MASFLCGGDFTMPTVLAIQYTIDQDRVLPNYARGFRNGGADAVDVTVRFVHNQTSFTYKNVQPGETVPCLIDAILDSGTTATVIEVLY